MAFDVHIVASVWCLLDESGEIRARGKVETTVSALGELVTELSRQDALRVGQEVGTMAYLVHDAVVEPKTSSDLKTPFFVPSVYRLCGTLTVADAVVRFPQASSAS